MTENTEISGVTYAAIRRAVAEELNHRSRVDAETHYQHHRLLEEWVECSIRRREMVMKVAQHVLGWGAVIGIGWVGKTIWDAFAVAARVVR